MNDAGVNGFEVDRFGRQGRRNQQDRKAVYELDVEKTDCLDSCPRELVVIVEPGLTVGMHR